MALVGTTVLDLAAAQLNDADNVRYPRQDLCDFLTFTLLEVAAFRPKALGTRLNVTLTVGAAQSVPAGAIAFLDAVGKRVVDRNTLDTTDPDWRSQAATTPVRDVMFDDQDPRTFWVYPPSPTGQIIEIIAAQTPPTVTPQNENAELPITVDYAPALVDGILAFAYARATGDANFNRATRHGQAFYQALGASINVQARLRAEQIKAPA